MAANLADKIISLITNNGKITFAAYMRNELRVLSAENSFYYTSADLTLHTQKKYLKSYPEFMTSEASNLLRGRFSVGLSGIYKSADHGENAVRRTAKNIAHTFPESSGPYALGYRFGPAIGAKTADSDSIAADKNHSEKFAEAMGSESVIDAVVDAIKSLEFADCVLLQAALNGRMRKLYQKMEDAYVSIADVRVAKLREELAELEKAKRT